MFDNISKDDLMMAFFPCTLFQENNQLLFRGEANQQKTTSEERKLEYVLDRHGKLNEMYSILTMLCLIAIRRRLKLIIENPYTQPHYLTLYFPLKPTIIDKDRTVNGDFYRKPTQYWFINIKPQQNFIFEPLEHTDVRIVERQVNKGGLDRQILRSMIHPQYANRFIRTYIEER